MAPREKNAHHLVATENEKASHQSDQQFLLDFYGTELNVIITHEDESIGRWISEVRHKSRRFLNRRRLCVGLSFGSKQNDSISTIHLSVARKCMIIQLHRLLKHRKAPVPASLSDFFSDNHIMFVGINNRRQARILQSFGIATDQIYDICKEGNKNASYKEILVKRGIDCPFDLSPQVTNSNWSKTKLDKDQISQAAGEAFVSLKIGVKLFTKKLMMRRA